VPPARWGALVPEDPLARTHLLDALFQAGAIDSVWESLGEDLLSSRDPNVLRRIVRWGLEGKRPEVALRAAESWKKLVEESRGEGPDLLEPVLWVSRAHLALGQEEAAYETLSATLERVEAKLGATSRTSLDLLCAMGEEYLKRDQVVTAEALFQQAVSRRSTYVPALLGLARVELGPLALDLLPVPFGGEEGQLAGQQVVARVAVGHLDDLAAPAQVLHVLSQDHFHDCLNR
jgi:hypothetical protein